MPAALLRALAAILLCLSAHGALAQSERHYPLAERGFLVMSVPAGWKDQVDQRDAKSPPTIALRPQAGAPFEVRVTPLWPNKDGEAKATSEELKRSVAATAEAIKGQAVESYLVPVELIGSQAQGYYFRATDRAPKRGEYKYIVQGLLGFGELRIAFTILTNDGQDAVVSSAFALLRNAKLAHAPASLPVPQPLHVAKATGGDRAAGVPPIADSAKLFALLGSGNFTELDSELSEYQDAYRSGVIGDEEAVNGLAALSRGDPDLKPAYDNWVAAKPDSYNARVARARFLTRLGKLARGDQYVSKTSQAQLDGMRMHLKAAREDLELALKLDSKPVFAYNTLIVISQYAGQRGEAEAYMNQAIALDPHAFGPRSLYLATLRPEWGGSLKRMELAIEGWKASLEEPQILRLSRMLQDAKWRSELAPAAQLVEQKRYKEALALYDQTLAQAPVARAYSMRGYSHAQLGQHDKAIADYNRSLEIDPDSNCGCRTIASRAYSYLKVGALDKALVDLRAAADDDDAWATRELAVIYLTGRYGMQQDYVAARRWCERSAKQGDGLSMYCMGGLLDKGLGGPKDERAAAQWYEGAANRGVPDAQADFAHMLWHGQGVAQDRERAIKYWRAAAQKGNKRAATQLESNLSGWEHFSKVSVPGWIAEQRDSSPWMYLVLSSLGLGRD